MYIKPYHVIQSWRVKFNTLNLTKEVNKNCRSFGSGTFYVYIPLHKNFFKIVLIILKYFFKCNIELFDTIDGVATTKIVGSNYNYNLKGRNCRNLAKRSVWHTPLGWSAVIFSFLYVQGYRWWQWWLF